MNTEQTCTQVSWDISKCTVLHSWLKSKHKSIPSSHLICLVKRFVLSLGRTDARVLRRICNSREVRVFPSGHY